MFKHTASIYISSELPPVRENNLFTMQKFDFIELSKLIFDLTEIKVERRQHFLADRKRTRNNEDSSKESTKEPTQTTKHKRILPPADDEPSTSKGSKTSFPSARYAVTLVTLMFLVRGFGMSNALGMICPPSEPIFKKIEPIDCSKFSVNNALQSVIGSIGLVWRLASVRFGSDNLETTFSGVYLRKDHQYSACRITSPNTNSWVASR